MKVAEERLVEPRLRWWGQGGGDKWPRSMAEAEEGGGT